MATTTAIREPASRRDLGPNFRKVWLSVLVSSTGDGMFVTALPLLAASLTTDPLLIAGIAVATRLPWLLLSMVTGAAADRMDRRRLLVAADLSRLLIVGVLGVAVLAGAVDIWDLYLCAFLLGVGETLHVNTAQAILPSLVPPDDLMQANARFASAQIAAAQFVGPPLGAAAYRVAAALPFLGDAATFAASAALAGSLPDEHRVAPPTTRLRDDVVDGLRFVFGHAALRRITVVLAAVNAAYFAAASLLVLYNDEQLGGSELTFTLLFVAGAIGTVISRFLVTAVVARIGTIATIAVALWSWALTTAGLALAGNAWVAVSIFLVLGVGNGLWMAVTTTIRQQLTPSHLLGRMNAAFRTVSWGVVPFGAAIGGVVARWTGIRTTFAVAAAVMLVIAASWRRVLAPVAAALAQHPPQVGAGSSAVAPSVPVFWFRTPTTTNFGDEITPTLIRAYTGSEAIWVPPGSPCLVGAGSTLRWLDRFDDRRRRAPRVIWGTGLMAEGTTFTVDGDIVVSVRGHLTRDRLRGAPADVTVGDPGLILPTVVPRPARPEPSEPTILVVPHYVDAADPAVVELNQRWEHVRVADVSMDPVDLATAIADATVVISTALHPLIVADAYGVPNLWLEVSDRLTGNGFKFRDYYSVFGIEPTPWTTDSLRMGTTELLALATAMADRPGIDDVRRDVRAAFSTAMGHIAELHDLPDASSWGFPTER